MGENWESFLKTLREELERDLENTIAEARKEGEKIIHQVFLEASKEASGLLDRRLREYREREQRERAYIEIEARKKLLEVREKIIEETLNEALKRLENLPRDEKYERILEVLLVEGMEEIGGKEFRVYVNAKDKEIMEKVAKKVSKERGIKIEVAEEAARTVGGVIVENPEGNIRYYNTFETRLKKMRERIVKDVYKILFR
ncbi:MAG: hypothetical protein DRJ51_00220 [Thermoprotei archaeon]|nr:MAG: hypothetical protein DRJ51_00220 [Thermoprotei archaeon]RLF03073.1 MAG: hypothetical protein DRJ59_01775 [Thermoprotei archaeon]